MRTRILETGISPEYTKEWTVVEAIRECIQNWVDIREEYGVKGTITWKDQEAVLKDFGPGMETRHLALGISEKGENSIGQFGEGLKLALLVLAREDRAVELRTSGQIIEPEIEYSEDYGTDVLRFRVTPMEPRHAAIHVGTSMRIECTQGELEAGKDYFVQFAARKPEFRWLEKDRVSTEVGKDSSIFVNGARVATMKDALFSYHLTGPTAAKALNRDRNTVDTHIVRALSTLVLRDTSSREAIETVILDVTRGGASWETGFSVGGASQKRARIWRRCWNKVVGSRAVLGSGMASDIQATYRGHRVVDVSFWWAGFFQSIGVPTAAEAIAPDGRKRKYAHVALKDLNDLERTNLRWAKRIARKVMGELPKIIVAEALEGMAGTTGITVNGVYDPVHDRVFLNRAILGDQVQTLHTLIHELVHRESGELDLTVKFETALLAVAVRLAIVMDGGQ